MTNLDSTLKSRDITLPTKVHLVKAMVFPVVMYGCESWTVKKPAAAAKLLQSCPTLCNPTDGSLPGSADPGILQARVLEWVAIEHRRIDAFELWCWKRLLRVPWTARRSNQSIFKEISPEYSLEAETPILWPPAVKN